MRAADAGKHVLCEKPAARTANETEQMIDHCVARGVVWMEAFMYRFHPQWRLVFERLSDGAIGDLRTVRSVFTFTVRDPQNIRRRPDAGGGSLYDVGAYCVNVSRWVVGRAPVAVSGRMQLSPEGVDEEFQGLLDFGGGQTALINSSLSQPYRHEVELLGTRRSDPRSHRVRQPQRPAVVRDRGCERQARTRRHPRRRRVPARDRGFAACVREGRQPEAVSHADTLENMRTIDALYESARSGRVVELDA